MSGQCPQCHQPLRPAARFCAACGFRLEQTVSPSSAPTASSQTAAQPAVTRVNQSVPQRLPGFTVKRIIIASAIILMIVVGGHVWWQWQQKNQLLSAILAGPAQWDDVERLLNRNPEFANAQNASHQSVLQGAIGMNKDPRVARLLIEKGADVNYHTNDGFTYSPLGMATVLGDVSLMKLLLDHGADINQGDDTVGTPLRIAILQPHPHVDVVTFLLAHGADANRETKTNPGLTPLQAARSETAPFLFAAARQPDENRTLAEEKQARREIIRLLQQAGATK
jgi:ankyrin repeat protein